jgi:NAD(P)-dependent dehydrogenase (short-subunit alcohol dehydrogenase family)
MSLQNKVVLITGAGSGMGRLSAQRASKQGAKVAALDINEAGLQETAKGHENIHIYPVDVTNVPQVFAVVEKVIKDLGNLDRVVNAAAIMPFGKILDHEINSFHRVMNINYGGLVNITKAALPNMLANKKGDFIIFSSMLGQMPVLLTGAYSASKFATSAFAEILMHEYRNQGVRFACICPPAVKTPLLQQAVDTAWPKILDENPPISPEEVLDAIEIGLEKGDFWIFPGKGTKGGWRARRFMPELIWKHIHKTEGW